MDTVRKSEQIRLEYHPHLFPDDLENKRTRSYWKGSYFANIALFTSFDLIVLGKILVKFFLG